MTYEISTDEIRSYLPKLRAGDRVLLSGRIYTSRDAAHKRICQALDNGSPLPYDLCDAIIYYAIRRNGAVYFAAVGGAGALIAKHITASTVVGYEDLGCESAKQMQVDRLPLIVAIDSAGENLYRTGRLAYQN